MKRHEIPTHLDAPDRFLFGLTAKQAMQLMAAAASTYGVMGNDVVPAELRLPLALVGLVMGLLLALLRPGGRAVEEWLVLLAFHLALPRKLVWRPVHVPVGEMEANWATLSPHLDWGDSQTEVSHVR